MDLVAKRDGDIMSAKSLCEGVGVQQAAAAFLGLIDIVAMAKRVVFECLNRDERADQG